MSPVEEAAGQLDEAQRQRLALFADVLIPGGRGLPSASAAKVHDKWIDRTLAARPDLFAVVLGVIGEPGEPRAELERLAERDPVEFGNFTFAISGSYFMNPRVRKILGYPWAAPKANPPYTDESDHYLEGGILDPVIQRGPLFL
jgi:hypothetical protein